jgi:hypothetical protein
MQRKDGLARRCNMRSLLGDGVDGEKSNAERKSYANGSEHGGDSY